MFVTANGSSIDLYDDVDESLLVSPTKTEERNEADGKRAERQRPWHRHHQSASPPSDAESFSRTPAKSTFGASLYNLDELNELETPARKSGPFAHPRADPSRPCCSGGAAADAKIQLRRPFDKSKSKRSQSLVPIPVSCLASLSNWEEDWENQQANWDQFEDWDIDSSSETSGDDTALGAQGYVNRMRESIESYFSSHSSKSSEDKCDDASDDLHEREARSCPGDAIGHLNRETITLDVHQAASTTRENKYPDPNEGGRADLEELGKHAFQLCLSPILPHSSPHCSSASGHMDGDEKLSFRKDAAADTSDQRRPSSLDDLPPHLRYFRNLRSLETHTGGINPHLNTRFLDPLRDATGQREREPTGERQCHKSCQIQPRCPEEREARRGRESRKEPVDQAEHSSERRSFATSSDPSRPVENPRLSASRKDFALRIRPQQNKADAEKKSIKTLRPPKGLISREAASDAGEMATTNRLQEQGADTRKRSTFKACPSPSSAGGGIVSKPRQGKENVRAFVPISSQRARERALFNLERNERYRQRKQNEMRLRAQQIDQARSEASSLKKFI